MPSLDQVFVDALLGGSVNVDQFGLHSTLSSVDIVTHIQFRSSELFLQEDQTEVVTNWSHLLRTTAQDCFHGHKLPWTELRCQNGHVVA